MRTRKKQNRIRDRIRPIAEDFGARWLQYCARKTARRVVAVTPRKPPSVSEHWWYGGMKGVKFYDVEIALREPHMLGPMLGPMTAGLVLEERLRKAVLTYDTCIEVCITFWRELHRVFGGMINWSNASKLLAKHYTYSHGRHRQRGSEVVARLAPLGPFPLH
jgi:hypothetical protein